MKKPTYVPHLSVYIWASQFCYGKSVLDFGCGEGFGLLIVSIFAKSVMGIDNSPQAIRKAKMLRYLCPAQILETDVALHTKVESDVILAFEIIEHIDSPIEFCAELSRSGKKIIFSVPHDYPHPLHKTEYRSKEDVQKLFPGREIEWFFLSGTSITKEIPQKIDRYIGIV